MAWLVILLIWVCISTMVGILADRWNRSGVLWAAIALIFSPIVAITYLLALGNANPSCPRCCGNVAARARVCWHCGGDLPLPSMAETSSAPDDSPVTHAPNFNLLKKTHKERSATKGTVEIHEMNDGEFLARHDGAWRAFSSLEEARRHLLA